MRRITQWVSEFEQKARLQAVDSALQVQAQERVVEDIRLVTPGG